MLRGTYQLQSTAYFLVECIDGAIRLIDSRTQSNVFRFLSNSEMSRDQPRLLAALEMASTAIAKVRRGVLLDDATAMKIQTKAGSSRSNTTENTHLFIFHRLHSRQRLFESRRNEKCLFNHFRSLPRYYWAPFFLTTNAKNRKNLFICILILKFHHIFFFNI